MIATAHQTAIARQLDDWQILPRSERLSELYFADAKQLPAAVRPHATQKLIFIVHNLEHQTTNYHYKLVALSDNPSTKQALGEGALTLAHDQFQTINETVTIPAVSDRVAIRVELEYEGVAFGATTPSLQKQAIQYWEKVVGFYS